MPNLRDRGGTQCGKYRERKGKTILAEQIKSECLDDCGLFPMWKIEKRKLTARDADPYQTPTQHPLCPPSSRTWPRMKTSVRLACWPITPSDVDNAAVELLAHLVQTRRRHTTNRRPTLHRWPISIRRTPSTPSVPHKCAMGIENLKIDIVGINDPRSTPTCRTCDAKQGRWPRGRPDSSAGSSSDASTSNDGRRWASTWSLSDTTSTNRSCRSRWPSNSGSVAIDGHRGDPTSHSPRSSLFFASNGHSVGGVVASNSSLSLCGQLPEVRWW